MTRHTFKGAQAICKEHGFTLTYGHGSVRYFISPVSNGWQITPADSLAWVVAYVTKHSKQET